MQILAKRRELVQQTNDIEKKAVATFLRLATTNTVRKQFYRYLLENGYVERVWRGAYRIATKGDRLLEILS